MKPQKWDSISLLRLEKSADSLLKISNNILFAFISLIIFIPLISIMRFYFDGTSASPLNLIDILKRFSIGTSIAFIGFEVAGVYLAGRFRQQALKMYDYIDNRRNKVDKVKAKGR